MNEEKLYNERCFICLRDYESAKRRLDLNECLKVDLYLYPHKDTGPLIEFIEKRAYDELQEKLNKAYKYALSYQLQTQGGLAGRAFTDFTCLKCDQEFAHPDTNVPVFCNICTQGIKDKANE